MKNLSDAEIKGLKWGDACFFGYYWEDNPEKPILILRLQPANQPLQEVVCDWATRLKMNVSFENWGGVLLTWEVSFVKDADSTWKVFLDFASDGDIEFHCNSLGVRAL